MTNKKVTPPIFSNDVSYKSYSDVGGGMWYSKNWTRNYCAITIFDWQQKSRKTVSTLTVTDLHKDTGLQAFIAKLDNAFQDEVAENV